MIRWMLPSSLALSSLLAPPALAEPPAPRATVQEGRLVFDCRIQPRPMWPDDAPPDWALASPEAIARYDSFRWQQRTGTALLFSSAALTAASLVTLLLDKPTEKEPRWGELNGTQKASFVGAMLGAGSLITSMAFFAVANSNHLGMAEAYERSR